MCSVFSLSSIERGADWRSPAPEALGDVGERRCRLVQQPGPANAPPLPEPDAAAADTVLSAGTAGTERRSIEDSRV